METGKQKLFSLTKKDFIVQTFRVGGNGGQHRDKTSNGVRIIHKASGAVASASDSRSQIENRTSAFRKLIKSSRFQIYLRGRTGQFEMAELNEADIKVEIRKDNHWVELPTG